MNFKVGDRVMDIEHSKRRRGTVIDATKTEHGSFYGELGIRFDNEDYDSDDHFHIVKYFKLMKITKLHEVLE